MDDCEASKVIQSLFPFLSMVRGTLTSRLRQCRNVHTSSDSFTDKGPATVPRRFTSITESTQRSFFMAWFNRVVLTDLSVTMGRLDILLMSSPLGRLGDMPFRVSSTMFTT